MRFIISLCLLLAVSLPLPASEPPRAKALSLAPPTKLPEASRLHLAGKGTFWLLVDPATGRVTSIVIEKSTGQTLLDQSAIQAFQKWRFAPGSVKRVHTPVIFTASSDVARYQ
jgi:TonB family protein